MQTRRDFGSHLIAYVLVNVALVAEADVDAELSRHRRATGPSSS